MALIKCPECQTEVSDRASACPRCGYPISKIQSANVIKMKMPAPSENAMGKFRLIDMDTRQELIRVAAGGVAQLESQKPIHIGVSWGVGFKPYKSCCFTVEPGKKYSVSWTQGWVLPGMVCNEVDVFDSD